jgi:hypothetical protein
MLLNRCKLAFLLFQQSFGNLPQFGFLSRFRLSGFRSRLILRNFCLIALHLYPQALHLLP